EEYIEENGSRRNRWFKGRLEEEKEEDPETEAEEEVEAEEGGVTENRTSESADESEKGKGEENFSNEPAK
ncbi:MAG: hypothetical protein IJ333_01165, partial [Clostridia bacterium]|nr:hypothetical protein [Clostridia bacterium]